MPIDPSIPLQYTPIQPMQALSSLLSNQKQMQEVKQGDINLKERKFLQGFLSNPSNYTGEDGSIDLVKARSLLQGAPTTGMDVLNHMANTQQAITTSQREISSQTDENRNRIASVIAAMPTGVTPEQFGKTLDVIGQQYKGMDTSIALAKKHYGEVFGSNPKAADQFRQEMAREVLPQPTQQAMQTPEGVQVVNGQTSKVVNIKPGAAIEVGATIPGTSTQMQLPPTTPVFNPETQTPGYLGSTGGSGYAGGSKQAADAGRSSILKAELSKAQAEGRTDDVKALQRELSHVQSKPAFVASGPALGQAENVQNNVAEMSRHYGALNDAATGNQLAQGLTSNIKQLADSAITGTESGRKSYVTGLLNALHLGNQSTGDLQKDTDLLEKNLAQLNLSTPAASDAARVLVSAARPHSGMHPEAIKEAADQLAGQIRANVAMRNMLTPYKLMGDVSGYTAARQKLESIADPRAFQFHAYNHDDQVQMLKKMSPQDRQELRSKIQQLDQMGMFK